MTTRRRRTQYDPKKMTKYAIGGLWTNTNKCDGSHPDLMGTLDCPKILVDDLVRQYAETGHANISIAAWGNKSAGGADYLTLSGLLPQPISKTPFVKK